MDNYGLYIFLFGYAGGISTTIFISLMHLKAEKFRFRAIANEEIWQKTKELHEYLRKESEKNGEQKQ